MNTLRQPVARQLAERHRSRFLGSSAEQFPLSGSGGKKLRENLSGNKLMHDSKFMNRASRPFVTAVAPAYRVEGISASHTSEVAPAGGWSPPTGPMPSNGFAHADVMKSADNRVICVRCVYLSQSGKPNVIKTTGALLTKDK